MGYNNPFSFNQDSNYSPNRPINSFGRPEFSDRPLIGHQPIFGYETTPQPFKPNFVERPGNNRPVHNERPIISKPVYNERPSFSSGSQESFNERPNYSDTGTRPDIDERPNGPSNARPVYNERPNYNERPYQNERPVYNERPNYNNERPDYERPSYNERPNNERPNYNERPSYNERPNYNERPDSTSFSHRPKPSNGFSTSHSSGGQQKPSVSRPNLSEEGSTWGRPPSKNTTPRPTWSVGGDEGETTSSRKRISEQSK